MAYIENALASSFLLLETLIVPGCTLQTSPADALTRSESNFKLNDSADSQNFLDDKNLRKLLSNVNVSPAPLPPGAIIGDRGGGEAFLPNGVYQRFERTLHQGIFEIENGKVCVQGPDIGRRCRFVIQNSDGTFTFIDNESGNREIRVISPR